MGGGKVAGGGNIAAKRFSSAASPDNDSLCCHKKGKSQCEGLHLVSGVRAGRVWRRRHIGKQQVSAGKRQFAALSQATFISLVGSAERTASPSATLGNVRLPGDQV